MASYWYLLKALHVCQCYSLHLALLKWNHSNFPYKIVWLCHSKICACITTIFFDKQQYRRKQKRKIIIINDIKIHKRFWLFFFYRGTFVTTKIVFADCARFVTLWLMPIFSLSPVLWFLYHVRWQAFYLTILLFFIIFAGMSTYLNYYYIVLYSRISDRIQSEIWISRKSFCQRYIFCLILHIRLKTLTATTQPCPRF